MADKPWSDNPLSRGQIIQALERKGCRLIEEPIPGSAVWEAPTGRRFSISYEDCDATVLESIVEKVEQWVQENRGPDKHYHNACLLLTVRPPRP